LVALRLIDMVGFCVVSQPTVPSGVIEQVKIEAEKYTGPGGAACAAPAATAVVAATAPITPIHCLHTRFIGPSSQVGHRIEARMPGTPESQTAAVSARPPPSPSSRSGMSRRCGYAARVSLPAPTPDNRAVVTGASSGIGTALAVELARRGYSLILVARRGELLNELAATLTADHGVTAEVRAVDLSAPEQREPLCAELAARDIAILCNNAGIATFGPVAELDPAYERAQVQLNTVAVHDLTLAVLPGMIKRGAGGILISGSAAGNMPIPNNATYAATKAFANTFSESLRGEVADLGVNVTLLAPGPVRTEDPDPAEASIVDKLVPDFLWVDTAYTATLSIDALARNRMRVVPGVLSKGMSLAGQFLPRSFTSPVAGRFYRKLGE
jgi:short-subunit dehydrogenase